MRIGSMEELVLIIALPLVCIGSMEELVMIIALPLFRI